MPDMKILTTIEREVRDTANEIDQIFRQQHSSKDVEHLLMRLVNRTQKILHPEERGISGNNSWDRLENAREVLAITKPKPKEKGKP